MGLTKRAWIESQERGWDAPEKHVCEECFEDGFLKSVVEENVAEMVCDYCGNESATAPIAAPLSSVMGPIARALFVHFAEPGAAGLPRDSGEWVGEERITDTWDALESLPLECHGELFDDIAESFHNTAWYPCAEGHWLNLSRHIELGYSWSSFVDQIKYRSRFFFGPPDLLGKIGAMAEELGLVEVIPSKTMLFRVRIARRGLTYKTIEDVGPPPTDAATAGRMNPAGISYFYLALEADTAVAEVVQTPGARIALGRFMTKSDLRVLNLTKLPEEPSVFNNDHLHERETILFLEDFVDAITGPVTKDGQEHIDYVPSQVVSEYLAQVFRTADGATLDAVLYPSATLEGGTNMVIFPLLDYPRKLADQIELISVEERDVGVSPSSQK